jgi:hypothetical protein
MRETSIEVYEKIKGEGLLSRRRFEVYAILYDHGPMTGNEIIKVAKSMYPDANQSGFNARLSELKKMGVAVEVGEKPDDVSGNRCYLWDVTSKLPTALPKINRLPRAHLEKCRDILAKIWESGELPTGVRDYITSQFDKGI